MKKALRRWITMAFLSLGLFGINTSKAQGSVSLQVFYDELQPYGNWMEYNQYGYVWIPNVDRDFTPYSTNGYWVNTEYGNTWVSDYDWGWAPFHYGRWFYDDYYGWMWAPDTEWAPAWVAWRSGGGYYGWAPLMPGFSINVSFNYYNNIPNHYWNFVPYRYITYHTLHNHCVQRPQVINIINQTTIITNNYKDGRRRTYFTGPTRNEMERNGHERVPVYTINDRSRPGRSDFDRGSVSFYKPEIDREHHGRTSPAPSHMVRSGQNGNQKGIESRGQRSSEFHNNSSIDDTKMSGNGNSNGSTREHRQQSEPSGQQRTFTPADRSQQRQSQNDSRSFDQQREKLNQNHQRFDQQQRSSQVDQQNRSQQSVRDYSNSQQRTQMSSQRDSHQRSSANDQRYQRQRSTVNPNSIQRSGGQPQREQQVRTKSFEHQSSQPSHQTGGSNGGSSRRRH